MISILAALILSITPVYAGRSGNAVDACAVKDCTCEVRESTGLKTATKYTRMVVIFEEDSDRLSPATQERIKNYVASSAGPLYLFGYADQCGDSSYNADLSRRRTQNVSQVVGRRVHSARYYGEIQSKDHSRHDRKVVISARPDFYPLKWKPLKLMFIFLMLLFRWLLIGIRFRDMTFQKTPRFMFLKWMAALIVSP